MAEKNLLHQGIHELPPVLRRLVEAELAAAFSDARRLLRRRRTPAIRLAGHGPADNTASYSVYSLALLPGLPAGRDAISPAVCYGTDSALDDSALVGLPQSGLDAEKPSRLTKVTLAP
jgi:hypothetical protein